MKLKVFTPQKWKKRKAKLEKRIEAAMQQAEGAGYNRGRRVGRESQNDLLAAVLFEHFAKEPGQVELDVRVQTSLIGSVQLGKVTTVGNETVLHIYVKSLLPD